MVFDSAMQCNVECLKNCEMKVCLSVEQVKEEGILHCRTKTIYPITYSANSITKLIVWEICWTLLSKWLFGKSIEQRKKEIIIAEKVEG